MLNIRLVAHFAMTVTTSLPTMLESPESIAVIVSAPAVFKTTPVKV